MEARITGSNNLLTGHHFSDGTPRSYERIPFPYLYFVTLCFSTCDESRLSKALRYLSWIDPLAAARFSKPIDEHFLWYHRFYLYTITYVTLVPTFHHLLNHKGYRKVFYSAQCLLLLSDSSIRNWVRSLPEGSRPQRLQMKIRRS